MHPIDQRFHRCAPAVAGGTEIRLDLGPWVRSGRGLVSHESLPCRRRRHSTGGRCLEAEAYCRSETLGATGSGRTRGVRRWLRSLVMTNRLADGDPAPAFTLPDADGNEVSLADFAGQPLILYFYPAAMTPGCTTQAVDFTAAMEDLSAAGLHVVGVSPDTQEKLIRFRDQQAVAFPLLSDVNRKTPVKPTPGPTARSCCTASWSRG